MRLIISTLACPLLVIALLTSCGGGSDSATPSPSVAATTASIAQPSATASIEDEVRAAYLDYWTAYSAALLDLDPSLATNNASGAELDRIANEIDGYRAQGLAMRIRVEHNFTVLDLAANTATVVDDMTNNSFFVDAVTKEPPEAAGNGEQIQDTFYLEKINGRWLVVSSTRLRADG